MQQIRSLAARRELGGLAAGIRVPMSGSSRCEQPGWHRRQWTGVCAAHSRSISTDPGRSCSRRRVVFVGEKSRQFSSQAGAEEPPGSSDRRPHISVVGIPDPLTWIRCKVLTFLTDSIFDININSADFERGVKQALVQISSKMCSGRYHELKGLVSDEMVEYVEERCRSLTDAQRKKLAVNMEDILFVLPEDISVVFDQFGRKFCFVVLRFWLLSSHEGPDDPEGTKIFKVSSSGDGDPEKKIATAVYEFHRELTTGASTDWTVTIVWHWHWKLAE